MTTRSWLVVLAALTVSSAHAATLGLLPCTTARDFTIAKANGTPRVVVARTTTEWREAWKAAGGAGPVADVDFDRNMIVGVVNGSKDDRVIYRIQLDSAAAPSALEVHVAIGGAPCGFEARTGTNAGAQFVVTPRSALAVHFVLDAMIDGRFYATDPASEGVGTTDLGTIAAATTATKPTGKAATREDAEHAVFETLTAAQKATLARGPLDRPLKRFPHGWTKLDVSRDKDHWSIRYESFAFTVDVASGKVTKQ